MESTTDQPIELPHTPVDPNNKQIVVVGGGISGITTAYYLQRQGKDVLLVESLDDVAQAATKVSVPILQRYQAPLLDFQTFDRMKSQYCPVRMWYKAQQLADTFTSKAFYRAYGWDGFKNLVDPELLAQNMEKLTYLTQSNYTETLNLIQQEQFQIPISNGHLFVGDDKSAANYHNIERRKFRILYKDCDIFELKNDDPAYLFPALQQENIDLHGGLYTPSSLVIHPEVFTKFLKHKILQNNNIAINNSSIEQSLQSLPNNDQTIQQQKQYQKQLQSKQQNKKFGKVDFAFNTKAVGFTMLPNNQIGSIYLEHREEVLPTAEELAEHQRIQDEKVKLRELYEQELSGDLKGQTLPGPNVGELTEKPKMYKPVSTSEVAVDKVILCNGYQAYQITEDLVEEGPLLQVVPVRSLAFDIYDKTRARFHKSVSTLFPTYPTTFYPEDPEFMKVQQEWEERCKELGVNPHEAVYGHGRLNPVQHPLLTPPKVEPLTINEIENEWNQQQPMNLHGVSSVEFGLNGLTLVQDLYNPRHIYGYMGKDMAQIGDNITDRHLQSIMGVLETIRKIPQGSLIEVNPEAEKLQRRTQIRQSKGGRYLSMEPKSMALHTVGHDGLPVIGNTPHIPNLYFNTGHGTSPQNTAIIGAKLVATMISQPKFGAYIDVLNQQATINKLTKTNENDGTTTFHEKPTKFDLDRLFNVKSLISKVKNNTNNTPTNNTSTTTTNNDGTDTSSSTTPTETPSLFQNINAFSPSRWALHKFTPIWFEDAISSKELEAMKQREADEKRAQKRALIQQRLREKNQQFENQPQ